MKRSLTRWSAAALVLVSAWAVAGCSNELKVTGVEPAQGAFGGGEDVVITGNGFQPGRGGVTVRFGTKSATSVVVAASDKISVSTPAGDPNTTVDVSVIFDDGRAFKLTNGFRYLQAADQRGTMDKAFNKMGTGKK